MIEINTQIHFTDQNGHNRFGVIIGYENDNYMVRITDETYECDKSHAFQMVVISENMIDHIASMYQ